MTYRIACLVLVLALSACGTPQQSVISMCTAADATLRTLTVQKAQGKLSDSQIESIDQAVTAIDPICGAETIPETADALDVVERQLLIMQGVKGVK